MAEEVVVLLVSSSISTAEQLGELGESSSVEASESDVFDKDAAIV